MKEILHRIKEKKRLKCSARTILVLMSVALMLLFVLAEVLQFYSSTSHYLHNQGATLEDAEFSHLGTLLSEDFAQLETVAKLTIADQQLGAILQNTTEKTNSANTQVIQALGYLHNKGRVIQPEVDAIQILTDYGAYYTGNVPSTSANKEEFLTRFGLESGGWHFPGDPIDETVARLPAYQRLASRVFYVLPFSVHSENDSCVCVVFSASFLSEIMPQNSAAAILSPTGTVLVNQTSLSDEALGGASLRSTELPGGATMLFESTGAVLSSHLRELRIWLLVWILVLFGLATLLSLFLSKPLVEPLKAFSRQLAGADGTVMPQGRNRRRSIPIREHILVTLLVTVFCCCLLFSLLSVRFFSAVSSSAFRSASEDSFKQVLWETENFFENQYYATLYAAYSGQLQTELAKTEDSTALDSETKAHFSEILSSYQEVFQCSTALNLYDAQGNPLACTEAIRFDHTALPAESMQQQTLWEIRKMSGVWNFVLAFRINDIQTLNTIGYLLSYVDEIYLADAYTSLPAGVSTAYLHQADGLIFSSTDKLRINETMPEAGQNTLTFSAEIRDTPLTLTVIFDDTPLISQRQTALIRTMYLLFVILLLTVVVSLLLSHYVSERLYRTFHALSTLTPDNMREFVPETSIMSEIDRMNEAFAEMTERVQTLHQNSLENERREKELALSWQRAKFAMLQAQINPHFLYNSFEAITFMIRRDEKETAIRMLGSLSTMLRYAVRAEEPLVPVTEEVIYAKTYMEIMQLRYAGKLNAVFDLADEVRELKIVKFTLQPILENAINHGLRPRGGQGTIRVTGMAADGKLIVTIRDDGVGMDESTLSALQTSLDCGENGKHIGLSNIHNRIRSLYGQEYGLRISAHPGSGTVVTILLPRLPREEQSE